MKLKNKIKKNHLISMFIILCALFDCYEFTRLLTKEKFEILRHRNENSKKLRSNKTNGLMKIYFNRESLLKDNILKYKDIIVPNTSSSFLQLENRNQKDVCEDLEVRKERMIDLIHVLSLKIKNRVDLYKIDSSDKAPDTIYSEFIKDFTVCIKFPNYDRCCDLEEKTKKVKQIIEALINNVSDFTIDMKEPPLKSFEALLPDIRTCMDKKILFEPKCDNIDKLKDEFVLMFQKNLDSKVTENVYFTKPSKNLRKFFSLLQKCPNKPKSDPNIPIKNESIELLNEQIKKLGDENKKLLEDIKKLDELNNKLNSEIKQTKEKLNNTENELNILKNNSVNWEKVNKEQLDLINECNSKSKELIENKQLNEQKIVNLDIVNKNLKESQTRAELELKKIKEELAICIENKKRACKSDLEKSQSEIDKINGQLSECLKKNTDLTEENKKIKDCLQKDQTIKKLNEQIKEFTDKVSFLDLELAKYKYREEIGIGKGLGLSVGNGSQFTISPQNGHNNDISINDNCPNELKSCNDQLISVQSDLKPMNEKITILTKENKDCTSGWEVCRSDLSNCQTNFKNIENANKVCTEKSNELQKQINSKNEENTKINDELVKCKNTNECEKKYDNCISEKEKLNIAIGVCNAEKKKVDLPSIKDFLSLMNADEKECLKLKEVDQEIKRICLSVNPKLRYGPDIPGAVSTYRNDNDILKNPELFKILNNGGTSGI